MNSNNDNNDNDEKNDNQQLSGCNMLHYMSTNWAKGSGEVPGQCIRAPICTIRTIRTIRTANITAGKAIFVHCVNMKGRGKLRPMYSHAYTHARWFVTLGSTTHLCRSGSCLRLPGLPHRIHVQCGRRCGGHANNAVWCGGAG